MPLAGLVKGIVRLGQVRLTLLLVPHFVFSSSLCFYNNLIMNLQVHYLNVNEISQNSQGDTSGVYLYYTRQPQPKIAGVLSLHVDTKVPAMARYLLQ